MWHQSTRDSISYIIFGDSNWINFERKKKATSYSRWNLRNVLKSSLHQIEIYCKSFEWCWDIFPSKNSFRNWILFFFFCLFGAIIKEQLMDFRFTDLNFLQINLLEFMNELKSWIEMMLILFSSSIFENNEFHWLEIYCCIWCQCLKLSWKLE